MSLNTKVGIIGVSHVGAHVANALCAQGLVSELHFVDKNEVLCRAQVNDIQDAMPFYPHYVEVVGHDDRYEELADCDIVVNAAGHIEAAAVSRDGELFMTTDECKSFASRLVDAGFKGIFVSVANPNDVVAYEFHHLTGYPVEKVIGSGTNLDSARFRHALSDVTGFDPESICAYMLGEHGFSSFAWWSHVRFGALTAEEVEEQLGITFDRPALEEAAIKGGYKTYVGKQCTEYSIANATVNICRAIIHNTHSIMPVSTLIEGIYGEKDLFTSIPAQIGAAGVERTFVPVLDEAEQEKWHKTCDHIHENIAQLTWW